MNKLSILIPDGDDDRALIVVRSLANSKRFIVHVLTSRNRSIIVSRLCKSHKLVLDEKGEDIRINRVLEISRSHKIDILLPIGEVGVKFVLLNLGLLKKNFFIPPIPNIDSLNIVSDKWSLSEFSRSIGLPYPKSFPLDNQLDIKSLDMNYPILLKPKIGAGGIGIEYFETESKLLSVLDSQEGVKYHDNYIIQEYIEGSDIDLSALCLNGEILAYTIQQPINKERKTFSFGKVIKLIDHSIILSLGKKCFSSLKWSGVAHIDFILDDKNNQFYMIDFNPRYWGTLMGSVVGGINFPYLACLTAQGIQFPIPEYHNSKFAILKASHLLPWLFGTGYLKGIPFSHTNLKYVITDPFPALKEIV